MREDFVQFMEKQVEAQNMKNPSLGELRSLFQINQVCKEENQRRNLTSNNFAWLCKIFASLRNTQEECMLQDREQGHEELISQPCETVKNEFRKLAKPKLKKMNFAIPRKISLCNLQIFSCRLRQIFISRYFV